MVYAILVLGWYGTVGEYSMHVAVQHCGRSEQQSHFKNVPIQQIRACGWVSCGRYDDECYDYW